MIDSRHGAGRDLLNPETERQVIAIPSVGSGRREPWNVRPPWHGLVYGNGRPGRGRETVVAAAAVTAWPLVYGQDGEIANPPPCSKFRSAPVKARRERVVAKPPRRRRSSAALIAEVLDLNGRGLVLAAIADLLNISDRRVREIIEKRSVSAAPA